MPKNKIEDLRNILFETMEKLMDDEDPMDLDRAETVAKVAQVVVNSAKVEVDFIKQTGHGGTTFIQPAAGQPGQLSAVKSAVKSLNRLSMDANTDLCLKCDLPACDETSPRCLIQIDRRAA